ncbi:MAG: class I SAM-dependent methyltransferase [Bryobacteraceae bacterium]|nr:class I SAM-dependent methyltransferase [Bryobacteraceae bacterium]
MLQVVKPVFSLVISAAVFPLYAQLDPKNNLAPYVPSPQPIVDRMLDAAALKPGETLFDLGCGDGRVLVTAAKHFKAKAVGVELNEKLVRMANDSIRQNKVEGLASVLHANLLDVDLSRADVVTLYLLTDANAKLKPRLEKFLKPGARVVSHDFEIKGWKPARVEEVEAHRRAHRIYVYEIGKSN